MFAKWAKQQPGKVRYVTRDYPLERECNAFVNQDLHPSACEAAVAVRLAREKGKAEAMEDWLFANQPSLTPAGVKAAAATVAGVTDFDARFAATLELVKADIAQGSQPEGLGHAHVLHERHAAARACGPSTSMRPSRGSCGGSRAASNGRRDRDRGADQGLHGRLLAPPSLSRARRADAAGRGQGEVFGFLGPNGAGKSTTLKLLMQLIYPDRRRRPASWAGRSAIRRRAQRIGFLAENPYYYDYLTAEELLSYFARLFGYRGADVGRARVARARRGAALAPNGACACASSRRA